MPRLQFDLRTVGLLVALLALYAHCLVLMGRATPLVPTWLLRETEWRMETIVLGWFGFGSYAICAAYISAWWRRAPEQRHRPMLAAAITCFALIGVWTWLVHMGAGYAQMEWRGELVSATLITAPKTLLTAVIGISVTLAIYFMTQPLRSRTCNEQLEARKSRVVQRKFPLVAFLWVPWILVVSLLLANQICELRRRVIPMSGGLRQVAPATTPPSVQPPASKMEK